jgi:GTP-binding protein
MFVDEVRITVHGGDGGNGCTAFRREKYVPRGGPDGGDGGDGGSVVLVASRDVTTLLALRYRPLLRAGRGAHGQGSARTGRGGEDLEVRVPVGTTVLDEDRIQRLCDLVEHEQRYVAARGGRGGRGNARFATATNRAPTRSEEGGPGGRYVLWLELKLLADVGLVGFPNAGKSTLISRVSAARPKIADYPFTTLVPHLGVVDCGDYRSFVLADIPGLIEGAHRGAGLGLRFLRHVERCRLLLHLVDVCDTERDAVQGMRALGAELAGYSDDLAAKPRMIVVTKADVRPDPRRVEAVRSYASDQGLACHVVSAVSGEGLEALIRDARARLDELGPHDSRSEAAT